MVLFMTELEGKCEFFNVPRNMKTKPHQPVACWEDFRMWIVMEKLRICVQNHLLSSGPATY